MATEFSITVDDHTINITSQPSVERIDGLYGMPITGVAWVAKGEWIAVDDSCEETPVPVTVVWHRPDEDNVEGDIPDWESPWLILPNPDITYIAAPVSGIVETEEFWREEFARMTPEEWGGENFEDGETIYVVPNIPGQEGYDETFGDWRDA